MNRLSRTVFALLFCMPVLCVPALARAQQPATPAGSDQTPPQGQGQQGPEQQNPGLARRPVAEPPMIGMSGEGSGSLELNVVVADKSGTPVAGLTQQEFTVLDNGQPRPILSFHAYSGAVHAGGPSVETIILMDTLNMDVLEAAQARIGIDRYLRQNGGHLQGPTSVFFLSEDGIEGQTAPTMDGNALADNMNRLATRNRSIIRSTGNWGLLEKLNLSVKALGVLMENEAHRKGRKLLIWVGPGWPLMYGDDMLLTQKQKNMDFMLAMNISKMLREDQITVYNVSIGQPNTYTSLYQGFVKGAKTVKDAMPSYLNTKVLAVESGGQVLGPDNDLARQIGICQQDASAYYTITFAPAHADKRDELHPIEVQTDKPYLKVRTTTGYYAEP